MPSRYDRELDAAARARAHAATLDATARVLRLVAGADMHVDPRRGDVGYALAALVEACGRGFPELPPEAAVCALAVVTAVDRAQTSPRPASADLRAGGTDRGAAPSKDA